MGILLASYLFIRLAVEPAIRLPPPPPPYRPIVFDGKGIDASELTKRIESVRAGFTESNAPNRPSSFKRELLVASKREEMRRLSFFQNPPPSASEPPPPDHGLPLLLA